MDSARSTHWMTGSLMIALTAVLGAAPLQTSADAARLRTLYFGRDFETGHLEGAAPAAANPDRIDLNAWYVLNLVRAGEEQDAVDAARKLVGRAPTSGWAWLALAGALNYQGDRTAEAIEAGARAFQLMPNDPDAVWIHAQTLAADSKRCEEAIAFVDSQRSRAKNPAEILVTKAYALYTLGSGVVPDNTKVAAAFDTLSEAERVDPANVNARYLHGTYLNGRRRSDEALPLLKQAVALAPGANGVHQGYWRAVSGSLTLSADQKTAEIQADMAPFLEKYGTRPGALYAVSSMSGDLKLTDERRRLEDRILRDFPASTETEWVMAYRWRDLSEANRSDTPEYRKLLTDYIALPKHHIDDLLGEAYRNLFSLVIDDKAATPDTIRPIVEGIVAHETTDVHITYGIVPVTLADHHLLLADAERIARDGIAELGKKVVSQRQFYKGDGEYQHAMDSMVAIGHDALGWVLFAEGKTATAEQELLKSYDLNHDSRGNLYHLGRLYEAQPDIARAEEYYVKGLGVQAIGVNPSDAPLRALYEKSHGGAAGFDKYITDLRMANRARRKDATLNARLSTPEPTPAFALKTLDGTLVSLDSLKGKIAVINFWGIWCGWCVHELPEYQKLFDQYKNDPDVTILTIDNDPRPSDVQPWMTQKKYSFPVLLDDSFLKRASRRFRRRGSWIATGAGCSSRSVGARSCLKSSPGASRH